MRSGKVDARLSHELLVTSLIKVIDFIDHGFLEICPVGLFPCVTIMHHIWVTIVDQRDKRTWWQLIQGAVFQQVGGNYLHTVGL